MQQKPLKRLTAAPFPDTRLKPGANEKKSRSFIQFNLTARWI